ncbi:Uncharacterised protein [Escherichia coli]|nr:Uncharacterised protein [Escherichia coli]
MLGGREKYAPRSAEDEASNSKEAGNGKTRKEYHGNEMGGRYTVPG